MHGVPAPSQDPGDALHSGQGRCEHRSLGGIGYDWKLGLPGYLFWKDPSIGCPGSMVRL